MPPRYPNRNRPPDHLPPAIRDHPAVLAACRERDIGRLFRTINNLTEGAAQFTASHIARRCGMTQSCVGEYMNRTRTVRSVEVMARIADGLGIPGTRLGLAQRPWEHDQRNTGRQPEAQPSNVEPGAGIGAYIRDLRLARGWSQDDLATALNDAMPEASLTRSDISRYESEKRMPTAARIIDAFSQALGAPEADLRIAIRHSWLERRAHRHGPPMRAWQKEPLADSTVALEWPRQPADEESGTPRPGAIQTSKPLRALRLKRGLTQEQAAHAVARAVADATGVEPTGIDAAWLGRLERGRIKWPSAAHRAALRAIYGAETDAELGLGGARNRSNNPPAPYGMADPSADAFRPLSAPDAALHLGSKEADDMHRRELIRSTLAAGALSITAPTVTALMTAAYESASFGQRAGTTNVHPGSLEQIDADIDRLARAYLTQPLSELITEMRLVRNMVFTALEGRQYPSQARQLYLNAAQLCGLMASASSDLGLYDIARTHARTAAICAELAGHPSVMTWIAATQSLIDFWDDRPADALHRAQAGHEYVTGDIDALRLYSLAARANARLGDAASAHRAIAEMTIIMDRTDASAHQSIFDFPAANALRCAGSSFLWLNDFADAQDSLTRALDIFEAQPEGGSYAHIAVTRIDLTLAYLGNHDFDAANETLQPVLELSPHRRLSGMVRRFDDLRAALTRPLYDKLPAARDLAERIDTLSSAAGG